MKCESCYCDICQKQCTGKHRQIKFIDCGFIVKCFDVCIPCFRDVRKYLRLKSKNRLSIDDDDSLS